MKKILLAAAILACSHVKVHAQGTISGYIYKDSLTFNSVDTFKVWLIQHNSTTNTLTAVDSTLVYVSYLPYVFSNKPAGTYLTKAAKINNTVGTTGIIPTYHDSSLYWNSAINIVHTGSQSLGKNIWMRSGTVTSGPGFISGNVNAGANKGTGAGIPNLLVYLRDANNKAIQTTYTDANGDFSFSNLPVGTYSLYPEEMNYLTTAYNSINVTAANPSVSGITFGKTATEIKPKTSGIQQIKTEDAAVIFPNPSTGNIKIAWKNASNSPATISVVDISGKEVYKTTTVASKEAQLDLSHLNTGMYFLKIATNKGLQVAEVTLLK